MDETLFAGKIKTFENAYDQLFQIAATYPAELRTRPGAAGEWSVREILAHLSGWMVEAQRRYKRYARGTSDIKYEIDNFNAVSVWLREGKDYDEVLEELRQLSAALATMAKALKPVEIERNERYGNWLDIMTHEAHEHLKQLEDFRKEHV